MTHPPLRILTLADTPADPHSGAAGTELRAVEALRALGHHVDSIWSDGLGRRIRHGNLHLLFELPRTYERAVVDALRRTSYDVVHVNQPHGFRAARAVHRLAPRAAFIHRSHGVELHVEETLEPWRERFGSTERGPLRRAASRLIAPLIARHSVATAREADGHIVSASLDADFLVERLGVAREKVAVAPQAAPDAYVDTAAPPMTPERLQRVLHVAQFAFFKAPMITASAINRLAEARPELRFTWVCDRAHHEAVRALVSHEARARLELLSWMPQHELRDQYDRCGIFLFPSFFEGFGKAFLEAMSRGACVIASDVGGMHDVIEHGASGILVPPGDAEALADASRAIIDDPLRAAAISAAAADEARKYTWARVANETAAFYRSRLAARERLR